jgi:SprT-like family
MGRTGSGMTKAVRQLKEQLIAQGQLPDEKRLKVAIRTGGEIALPYRDQSVSAGKEARSRSYDRQAITPIEYGGVQEAYDHFNADLFDGKLGDVFITYQRKANSDGYFSPDRFSGRIDKSGNHELALNPDVFIGQTDEQILQILVHEMVHVWQHHFGKPSPRGYHNKEFAAKMKSVGLQPSSTGAVGGKETGQRMRDYIIPDGPFTKAFAKLAKTGWKLNLQSAHRPGPKSTNNSKTKFTCSSCGQNAWGKPDLAIICLPCGIRMRSADAAAPTMSAPTPSYEITEPPVGAIVPSIEPPTQNSAKRKRGRPKGSKNKPKDFAQSYDTKGQGPVLKRKRGRPKGSKNKPKDLPSYDATPGDLR